MIERRLPAEWMLIMVVKLTSLAVNVEILMCRFVAIALDGAIGSGPLKRVRHFNGYGLHKWLPALASGGELHHRRVLFCGVLGMFGNGPDDVRGIYVRRSSAKLALS